MHKDFDAMLAELGGRPTFTVGGEKFTCRAKLPWRKFRSMLDGLSDDDSDVEQGTHAMEAFLSAAVVRADRDRFVALLNMEDNDDDDTTGISPGEISSLSEWLMEHYTGKLNPSDESSSPGPPKTGRPSKVVSLNPRTSAG